MGYALCVILIVACESTNEPSTATPQPDASSPSNDASSPPPPVDASSAADRQTYGPVDAAVDGDADADAAIVIVAGMSWSTPNGASWTTAEAGTTISGFVAEHPVLIPDPVLAIPAENYTVHGTFKTNVRSEFGLVTRGQQPDAGGGVVVFGSQFGGDDTTFVGSMSSPDWNPAPTGFGPAYSLLASTRYKLKVRAVGAQVSAKMWEATQTEPAAWQLTATIPWSTGRGVGHYSTGANLVVLESLEVTVP